MKFTRKYHPISEVLGSIERTGCEKLLCIRDCAPVCLTQKYGPQKSHNHGFLTVVRFFLTFLENYHAKLGFLGNRKNNLGESFLH